MLCLLKSKQGYNLPGGGMSRQDGNSPQNTLLREVKEELGPVKLNNLKFRNICTWSYKPNLPYVKKAAPSLDLIWNGYGTFLFSAELTADDIAKTNGKTVKGEGTIIWQELNSTLINKPWFRKSWVNALNLDFKDYLANDAKNRITYTGENIVLYKYIAGYKNIDNDKITVIDVFNDLKEATVKSKKYIKNITSKDILASCNNNDNLPLNLWEVRIKLKGSGNSYSHCQYFWAYEGAEILNKLSNKILTKNEKIINIMK